MQTNEIQTFGSTEPSVDQMETVISIVIPNDALNLGLGNESERQSSFESPECDSSHENPSSGNIPKHYRTKKQAGGATVPPDHMTTITNQKYKNAVSLQQRAEDEAYLQPCKMAIDNIQGLQYDATTGQFMMRGYALSAADVRDFATNEIPQDLDLPFLQFIYSIIWQAFRIQYIQGRGKQFTNIRDIGIYFPQIARALGKSHHIGRSDEEAFIRKLHSYNTIIGYIRGKYQPILVFTGEGHGDDGLIYFQSPYLMQVIYDLYKASIRLTKDHKPKLSSSGKPDLKPFHSTLVKASLATERNKLAACNVIEIVYTIENAGHSTPHIKARTLIDRNPQLKAKLEEQELYRQNQLLKRVFTKTWELLKTQTDLLEAYKDIQLPDPESGDSIPTMATLDKVYSFPHAGRISAASKLSDKRKRCQMSPNCDKKPPNCDKKPPSCDKKPPSCDKHC